MSDEDDDIEDESEDESDALECPYCGSADECEHMLLVLDLTFRTAANGALFDAFADRWSKAEDQENPDFDERVAFDELVEAVDALADASNEFEFEGGPGMSSTYQGFYCSSKARVANAVRSFEADSEEVDDEIIKPKCPFCGAGGECEHLLLLLDCTFRTADGGPLRGAFRNRWRSDADNENPRFDERAAFDEQVEVVDALADASTEYEFEGGPGMSSTYRTFYCSSKTRVEEAVRTYGADH